MNFEEVLQQTGLDDRVFFRPKDIYRLFCISRTTLERWRKTGLIETMKIGHINVVSRKCLKAFYDKGLV